jgi:hypothetical protein
MEFTSRVISLCRIGLLSLMFRYLENQVRHFSFLNFNIFIIEEVRLHYRYLTNSFLTMRKKFKHPYSSRLLAKWFCATEPGSYAAPVMSGVPSLHSTIYASQGTIFPVANLY